jgi:hypothetical protein
VKKGERVKLSNLTRDANKRRGTVIGTLDGRVWVRWDRGPGHGEDAMAFRRDELMPAEETGEK